MKNIKWDILKNSTKSNKDGNWGKITKFNSGISSSANVSKKIQISSKSYLWLSIIIIWFWSNQAMRKTLPRLLLTIHGNMFKSKSIRPMERKWWLKYQNASEVNHYLIWFLMMKSGVQALSNGLTTSNMNDIKNSRH